MPNQGYLSEAGASLVDAKLGLNVVPKTKVGSQCNPFQLTWNTAGEKNNSKNHSHCVKPNICYSEASVWSLQ